ncbi:Non-specific lipid-transfer protein Lac s 1-like protein [Drosera capensis]
MTKVLPCYNYLRTGSAMSAMCCDGVRSLDSMTRNTPDLQTAYACLVQAAKSYGISNVYAKQLPGKCGVKLGFAFDVNTDCSKIHRGKALCRIDVSYPLICFDRHQGDETETTPNHELHLIQLNLKGGQRTIEQSL